MGIELTIIVIVLAALAGGAVSYAVLDAPGGAKGW